MDQTDRRAFVTGALTLPALLPFGGAARAAEGVDAIVGRGGGLRAFQTVQAAIDAAPVDGRRPFRIQVSRGIFREKIVVTKPFVHLLGKGRALTTITFEAAAGHKAPDGSALGTRGCATITVRAPDFGASNLTIENGFDYIGNLLKAEGNSTRLADPQGVALMLDQGSNRTLIENVVLNGHQDTLFIDAGLSLFRNCRITGSVDFVFGAGRSLLASCEIVSRFRPGKPRQGYVAAPSTLSSQQFGLVFDVCRLAKERDVTSETVVLGRPWRPSREFPDGRYGDPQVAGHAAFLRCWMDDHISSDGWDEMGYTARSGARVFLKPDEARLFEYASGGPGAREGTRRRTLTAAEAAAYTPDAVLAGWRT